MTHRVLGDDQLSRAVLFGGSTPGPVGVYVVSVGYAVRGVPGAVAGWLALVSPAFVAVPLLAVLRRWIHLLDALRRRRRIIASGTLWFRRDW